MRLVSGLLCLAALQTPAAAQAAPAIEWPVTPAYTSLETPYGNLVIQASDYVYGATLFFDGKPTQPDIKGILNISYAYVVGKRRQILVSQDQGQTDCPVVYYWVTVDAKGYRITGPFGSCSPQIRVSTHGTSLRLETPDRLRPDKLDIWEFDGQKVRKLTVPDRDSDARPR